MEFKTYNNLNAIYSELESTLSSNLSGELSDPHAQVSCMGGLRSFKIVFEPLPSPFFCPPNSIFLSPQFSKSANAQYESRDSLKVGLVKSICLFPILPKRFYSIHLHSFSIYLALLSSEVGNRRFLYLGGKHD